MSLIRPVLLPDEHALGYEGRLNRLNGIGNPRRTWGIMQAWAASVGLQEASRSRVELLANVAGVEVGTFLREHTTFPYRCAFITELDQLPCVHGARPKPHILRINALALLRNEAYLCEACVAADIAKYGVSYWRRAHQLPGVFWCDQHGCALRLADRKRSMADSPQALLGESRPVDRDWVEQLRGSTAIARFLELGHYVNQRASPFDERDATRLVCRLTRSRGLDTSKREGSSPRLAALLCDFLDAGWLAATIPDAVDRSKAVHIDRILSRRRPWLLTEVHLALVAAMVDSAAQGIELLEQERDEAAGVPDIPSRQPPLTHDDARKAYVDVHGNIVRAGRLLGLSKQQSIKYFRTKGLPSLACSTRVGLNAALMSFLLDNKSIEESARDAAVSIEDLEAVLRTSASAVTDALKKQLRRSRRRGGTTKARAARPPLQTTGTQEQDHLKVPRTGRNAPERPARRYAA